jgi:Flp pilus assembly pilin Flp
MVHRTDAYRSARQRGQSMSEYIIIMALVAVAGIGLFAAFGDTLQNQMAGMSREMAGRSANVDIADANNSATVACNRAAQADSLSAYDTQTNAQQ